MTPRSRHRGPRAPIRWWSAASLRLHAALVVGVSGAAVATWFEWTRAHAGHEVAWVYTFEWPLLAAFGAHLWWRLLRADHEPSGQPEDPRPEPAAELAPEPAADPELAAWQAYLNRLNELDPPGRSPHERS